MGIEKTDIVILCSRLDLPGGIERAVVNLANLFAEKDHTVTLVVLDETDRCFYPLDKNISVKSYPMDLGITEKGNMLSRKSAFVVDIFRLKKLLNQLSPQVIISTEYPFSIAAFLAGAKKTARLLGWEHHHFNWLQKNRFWNFLFRQAYPHLNTVVCLNPDEKELFEEAGCTTSVIPNFVPRLPVKRSTLDSKKILTVGWLIKRKGVDMIPGIAEKIFTKHPDWTWTIVGSGEESEILQNSIRAHRLEDKITIITPSQPDLQQVYLDASIYVMTSRFECFPMVLLEAMTYGVPCVSFNCPTGPSSIIKHNEDGLLVETENIPAISDAICSLIEQGETRKRLGEKAYENVQRFSPEKIYALWLSVF